MIISIFLKFIYNDVKGIVIVLFNIKFKNKFKKNFKRSNINRVIKLCKSIKKIKIFFKILIENSNIKNIIQIHINCEYFYLRVTIWLYKQCIFFVTIEVVCLVLRYCWKIMIIFFIFIKFIMICIKFEKNDFKLKNVNE